jgi:MFS family permease
MSHVAAPNPEVPHVASVFEGRPMKTFDHIKLSFFWFAFNFVWGAFLGPVLAQEMSRLAPQSSAQTLGLLLSLGAIPALLIPLVVGVLSDRCTSKWGRRRPYMLVGGIMSIGSLGIMYAASGAKNINLYFVGYFALQFGMNTVLAAYSGIIPDLVPENERGKASGFMGVMSNVATLIAAVGTGLIVKNNPIFVYQVIIFVYTICLGLSLIAIPETPLQGPVPKINWNKFLGSLWSVLRDNHDFRWVWITRALMMVGFYSISPYITYFLRDQLLLPNPAATGGIVLGLILVGATISAIVGGSLSDKLGRKTIVYWSTGIIGTMALAFILAHSLIVAIVFGIIFGVGYGAYISVDWALGADTLPDKRAAAKDMAVWHIAMVLPQQVGPLIAGKVLSTMPVSDHVALSRQVGDFREGFISAMQGRAGGIVDLANSPERYMPLGFAIIFVFAAICFYLSGYLLKNIRGVK